jgi:hypothetical protein
MFHTKENLYFERHDDEGSVRIVKYAPGATPEMIEDGRVSPAVDLVLDSATWKSVVASVSRNGDSSSTFDQIGAVHDDVQLARRQYAEPFTSGDE